MRLDQITGSQLDAMVEADRERQLEEMEETSQEALERALERAAMAEVFLSMPTHEDPPHRREVTCHEWHYPLQSFGAITTRRYAPHDAVHSWAEWHFVVFIGGT